MKPGARVFSLPAEVVGIPSASVPHEANMLMMSRRVGERIVIGGDVEIHVAQIHRGTIRLAINAPGYPVFRGEVWDAIAAANRDAAAESSELPGPGETDPKGETDPAAAAGGGPTKGQPGQKISREADGEP